MNIAAVTDDGKTVSPHFGRASLYVVFFVEDGRIIKQELREKVGHREFQSEGLEGQRKPRDNPQGSGFGKHSGEKHQRMFATITDCEVLLARGMGQGAFLGLQQMGVRPILTDIPEIERAVQAVIDGSIEHHAERLH